MKTCTVCKSSLPLNMFGRDKYRPDGLNLKCKSCNSSSSKAVYKTRASQANYAECKVKTCCNCNLRLASSEFTVDRTTLDGLKNKCKECSKTLTRKWESNNRDKAALYRLVNRRNRSKSMQTLTADEKEDIATFYFVAQKLSNLSTCFHVDHIVPLRAKTLCGLHLPWNLRLLTKSDNLQKSNKLVADLIDLSAPAYRSLSDEEKKNLSAGW